jgi:hypothetical protein
MQFSRGQRRQHSRQQKQNNLTRSRRVKGLRGRRNRFETLESRLALSATQIAFVDSAIWDNSTLPAELTQSVNEVVVLDANSDGVQQMADYLAGRHDISAINLISHGEVGGLSLSSGTVTLSNLSGYNQQLATIGNALSSDGDVLLWGCRIAGAEGTAFVQAFADATGADVAASTDLTGSPTLGGNWNLEYSTGPIEAHNIFESFDPPIVLAAPVLNGANNFTTITEDSINNNGNAVSELIAGHVTDADAGDPQGIAVTGVASGSGNWQYNIGGSWLAVGTVTNTSALLLRSQDRLRFNPDGLHGTSGSVTFRAWDQSNGLGAGTRNSTSANGGSSAYSAATATATISVQEVNDSPLAVISNTVVFSDGTFNLSDYTKSVFTWGNGGTISEAQQLSGGNPDAYLRVTISVNRAASATNFARVAAVYIKNDAVYDPAAQGAISGINFSQDALFISGVGSGETIRPALMQDGKVFIANPLQTSPNTQWTATVANNRQATDFFLPSEDVSPVTRPNFSATGSPITLGFTRLNTTTGAPFTNVGGVDNWRAEVIPVGAGFRIGEGHPLTLDGSRSTDPDSTNAPLNNNDIVRYEWDLNYDGTFGADITSASPTSTVTFPDNFTPRPMALRVTDSAGATSLATSTLEVRNIAPSLTVNNPSVIVSEGQTATNSGTFNDVPADTVTLTASRGTVVANNNGTWSWTFNTVDDLANTNVTITATDDDGGQTRGGSR